MELYVGRVFAKWFSVRLMFHFDVGGYCSNGQTLYNSVATDCYYHECTECPRDLPEVVLQLTAKHSDTMVL